MCGFTASAAGADRPVILVWGDSLSAAYGVPLEAGWTRLLQQRLERAGYPHLVVNGSVTGETTAGGLARLPAALERHRPALVLLELGGNDGLRALPLAQLRDNLTAMVRLARNAGAHVLLFEMMLPPNYGVTYTEAFRKTFATVARAERATLVPFFLEPIAQDPDGFQEDGIHPSAAAQDELLGAVWTHLQPVLAGRDRPVRSSAGAAPQPDGE